jgi:hypothetical protein
VSAAVVVAMLMAGMMYFWKMESYRSARQVNFNTSEFAKPLLLNWETLVASK